jgi:hypothetical protein
VYDHNLAERVSDLLAFSPEEQLPVNRPVISRAVLAHGCSQWCELGSELGFTHDTILEHCHNVPDHSGKLLVLLEIKANAVSLKILEDLVLNACRQVPRPIHWVVQPQFAKLIVVETLEDLILQACK